ncbi:MAG: hypothetical protein JKY19_15925 [Alcanivoracaceae bacterium]|nr:hypothetical protein [Alcanivoracaceae bacterium]
MSICNEIQQKIADLTFNQTLQDQDILQHIETCQDCQDYQQTCVEINQAMNDMSNYDADDTLVESTLNSIISLQEDTPKSKRLLNTQWASALAASFMLISLIILFPYNSLSEYNLFSSSPEDQFESFIDETEYEIAEISNVQQTYNRNESNNTVKAQEIKEQIKARKKQMRYEIASKPAKGIYPQRGAKVSADGYAIGTSVSAQNDDEELDTITVMGSRLRSVDLSTATPALTIGRESSNKDTFGKVLGEQESQLSSGSLGIVSDKDSVFFESKDISLSINEESIQYQPSPSKKTLDATNTKLSKLKKNDTINNRNVGFYDHRESVSLELRQDIKVKAKSVRITQTPDEKIIAKKDTLTAKLERSKIESNTGNFSLESKEKTPQTKTLLNPAKQYLAEMQSLNSLTYQSDSGYWANTYLPGDSHMRLLEASLKNGNVADISNSISQNIQPFDHPDNSALSIYLNSDAAMVQQPTRMRLQVGIQASNRQTGYRQAMNIGLVFDLSNKTSDYPANMKALLLALLKSKQPGDYISLTIAGVAGGLLIKPEDFRHGPIQVALSTLFTKETAKVTIETKVATKATKGQALTLQQALATATAQLRINDDPSSHLGSSVLILFSANNIDNISTIESLVHANAIDGITLSTISLAQNNQAELTKLALAGQGHMRILQSANDAQRIIDTELLSSSRAVARAIRLRIRLAKGVKLIKVIDSYNLNHKQSQRVRDAEQSLDRRLSKNLGITADRGNDDEGIQIVIPAFFAGDTHVILLDIVVPQAGAIADVSMRYKDLLYLRNALTRKQLNLGKHTKVPGPLQLNVMKNVLASHFANGIRQASHKVRKGESKKALTILLALQKLYQSMRAQHPLWNDDIEMLKDENLLRQYIKQLNSTAIQDTQQINYIADSLQYISWRKNITKTQ